MLALDILKVVTRHAVWVNIVAFNPIFKCIHFFSVVNLKAEKLKLRLNVILAQMTINSHYNVGGQCGNGQKLRIFGKQNNYNNFEKKIVSPLK